MDYLLKSQTIQNKYEYISKQYLRGQNTACMLISKSIYGNISFINHHWVNEIAVKVISDARSSYANY